MGACEDAVRDSERIDEECARWDWARTAGVSASELRAWLTTLKRLEGDDLRKVDTGSKSARQARV